MKKNENPLTLSRGLQFMSLYEESEKSRPPSRTATCSRNRRRWMETSGNPWLPTRPRQHGKNDIRIHFRFFNPT